MFDKLDHVGVIVKDLNESIKLYADMLNLTPNDMGIVTLNDLGVKFVLLPIGNSFIELLEPIGTEGRFAKHLREKGTGLFHLSIFTRDYDAELDALKKKNYKVEEEATAQLFPGYSVRLAWLSPDQTGGCWIEIVDVNSQPPAPEGGK